MRTARTTSVAKVKTRDSKDTAGHVASGATRRASAAEGVEVPSSSAGSVAPGAATTLAAAKTAAAIQEVNDETEPGWIFGMVDGSVA